MKTKTLNLLLPFLGALVGSFASLYISSKTFEVEIYKQETPEKRMLYNQLSDQITLMNNAGIGLIMSYSLYKESEGFEKTISYLSKDCENAKSQIENIYFKLSAFSESSFNPEPLIAFDGACTPHSINHKNPIDLLEKYTRKNEEASRGFIKYLQTSLFKG